MADRTRTEAAPTSTGAEHQTSYLLSMVKLLVIVLTVPYRRTFRLYTWRPLRDIRYAQGDRKELIPTLRDFTINKYAELQSVQVAVSCCPVQRLCHYSMPISTLSSVQS